MSWIYEQATGKLFHDTELVGTGYAGHPPHVNNPNGQYIVGLGPLPRGKYTIGAAVDGTNLGRVAMPLIPDRNNDMRGRSAFYIHADSIAYPGYASEGCIVMPKDVRTKVSASIDRDLEVVRG